MLDADQPQGTFRCLAPREEGHEYYPDHGRLDGRGLWLIRSNQAVAIELVRAVGVVQFAEEQRTVIVGPGQAAIAVVEGQGLHRAAGEEGHEYYPDHGRLDGRGLWLIRSNQAGINFALYQAEEARKAMSTTPTTVASTAGACG